MANKNKHIANPMLREAVKASVLSQVTKNTTLNTKKFSDARKVSQTNLPKIIKLVTRVKFNFSKKRMKKVMLSVYNFVKECP